MNAHTWRAAAVVALLFVGCGNPKSDESTTEAPTDKSITVSKPGFDADTAYAYVARQVAFGPRVPGSVAQQQCAAWMEELLKQTCDTVFIQRTTVRGGDGKNLPCINLVGSINPQAPQRILLLAHWDSRPWSDMDATDKTKPIDAADDGGSGVAVLLEIARQIKTQPLDKTLGIDILLTDVEDYGKTEWGDESYALGTQYWARNPHVPGYKAQFGILLDMVGARNAQFPLEGMSTRYAGNIQQMVWQAAVAAGHSSYFPFLAGPPITDDHVFVNDIAKIPTIDIININRMGESAFAPHWHTLQDNLSIIDKNTLRAVGETVLQVIYQQNTDDAI